MNAVTVISNFSHYLFPYSNMCNNQEDEEEAETS